MTEAPRCLGISIGRNTVATGHSAVELSDADGLVDFAVDGLGAVLLWAIVQVTNSPVIA